MLYIPDVPVPHRVKGIRSSSAFTLIELLIVIAIISLLAATLVVGAMHLIDSARLKRSDALLGNLAHALNDYYCDFGAFPPSTISGSPQANDNEWWRYLTCTGTGFQRPQRADGTVRDTPFIEEKDLNLPSSGSPRRPRDGWKSDILYVYPVDNEIANITTTDPTLPTAMKSMTLADTYYHCCVISAGKPPAAMPTVTSPNPVNSTVEPKPTYLMKVVSGK